MLCYAHALVFLNNNNNNSNLYSAFLNTQRRFFLVIVLCGMFETLMCYCPDTLVKEIFFIASWLNKLK